MATKRSAVSEFLQIVETAGDTLVAVGVVGVKVDGCSADDTGVKLGGIDDVLSICVNHTRLGGAVGVHEVGVGICRITLTIFVTVSMHDKGGQLKAGEWGIVGEYGPELVQGPMSITSRKETAELARSAVNGSSGYGSGSPVVVNLYESTDKAGTVETRDDDETRIVDIFVSDIRHGGSMSMAIQNTFNLNRMGS